MPDLTDFPALEVAIGLVFLFFLLSLIASGINELLARVLSWRAKFLEEGIRNLLDDPGGNNLAKEVLEHPLVRGLQRHGAPSDPTSRREPSYIPAKTFVAALFGTLAPAPEGNTTATRDLVAEAAAAVSKIENPHVRTSLLTLLDDTRHDLDAFRTRVEEWYDGVMERVGGWYKRYIQRVLLVVSLVLAFALNADSFQVAKTLWNNDAVRTAVVTQADQVAKMNPTGTPEQRLERGAAEVNKVQTLNLPIGWSTEKGDPRHPPRLLSWSMLWKVLGIALTGFAVSLGAPFWFDLLGRATRLRSSGAKPGSGG